MPMRGTLDQNAASVIQPRGLQPQRDTFTPEVQRQDALARDEGRFQLDKQVKGMSQMVKDPANAKLYADAYGISYTPELDALLKDPKRSQQMLESVNMAKAMGIDSYDGYRAFSSAYLQSGGDPFAAAEAVKDYVPSRDMKVPAGYMRTGSGTAGKIPGVDASFYQRQGMGTRRPLLVNDKTISQIDNSINTMGTDSEGIGYDDPSKEKLKIRATQIYQQTGNPLTAVQQAIDELGQGEVVQPEDDRGWYNFWDDAPQKQRSLSGTPAPKAGAAGVPPVDTGQSVDQALPGDLPDDAGGDQGYTDEDIRYTAEKHGISEDEVRQRLGIQ